MTEPEFFQRFYETTWEQNAAHLGTAVDSLLSADELFTLAVVVAESLALGNERLQIPWCDDGRTIRSLPAEASSAELLPQRTDRTLEGYCERMRGLPTFFFQIPRLQLYHPAIWPRLARFCGGLYPLTGVPGNMAWTDAYFGRYCSTPFGVHLDGASNFTFGVCGRKTFYLWEPEYFHAHMATEGPHGYAPFLPAATKLTVGPGEVIYWPSRFYHVAVPDGRFSVTMNFAFYPELPQPLWLERAFRRGVPAGLPAQGPLAGPRTPRDLARAARGVADHVSGGGLRRDLLTSLVAHCTGLGFTEPPPLRGAVVLEEGDRVTRTAHVTLACVPDECGGLIVSSNGYASNLPDAAPVRRAIDELDAGERVAADSETRALLQQLFAWGAVERFWR